MSGQRTTQTARRLPVRRHSLIDPKRSKGQIREPKGRSFMDFFRNMSRKRRSMSSASIGREPSSSPSPSPAPSSSSSSSAFSPCPSVRVVVSVLRPQLYYKTVPVTMTTTTYDIIESLVNKYATCEEDEDPAGYFLMETHDTAQGNYSKVVGNNDKVMDILQRWTSEHSYFSLSRKPKLSKSGPLFASTPVLFSGVDSTLFSYPAFVEEGNSQQSYSDLTGDSHSHLTPPSQISTSHFTPPSHITTSPYSTTTTSPMSPFTHDATPKLPPAAWFKEQTDRHTNTDGSSISPPYSEIESPSSLASPASPIIIDSPTHQYIITGSDSLHNRSTTVQRAPSNTEHCERRRRGEEGEEGLEEEEREREKKRRRDGVFHFPSANPSSPTSTGFHDNPLGRDNNLIKEEEEMEEEERMEEVWKEEEERKKEEEEEEKEGRGKKEDRSIQSRGGVSQQVKTRNKLSQLMQLSIEGGLGRIMTTVVKEGVVGGGRKKRRGRSEVESVRSDEVESVRGEVESVRSEVESVRGEGVVVPSRLPELEKPVLYSIESDNTSSDKPHSQISHYSPPHPSPPHHSHIVTVEATIHPSPPSHLTHSLLHQVTTEITLTPSHFSSAMISFSPSRKKRTKKPLRRFRSEMNMLASLSSLIDDSFAANNNREERVMGRSDDRRGRGGEVGRRGEETKSVSRTLERKRSGSATSRSRLTNQNAPSNESDLVSPMRRYRLVSEAAAVARTVALRRAKTFSVGRTSSPVLRERREGGGGGERREGREGEDVGRGGGGGVRGGEGVGREGGGVGGGEGVRGGRGVGGGRGGVGDLMSSAHRERLLLQALAAVRQRRLSNEQERERGGGEWARRRHTHSAWDLSRYSYSPNSSSSPSPKLTASRKPGKSNGPIKRPLSASLCRPPPPSSSSSSSASSSPTPLSRPLSLTLVNNNISFPSLPSTPGESVTTTTVTMETSFHPLQENYTYSTKIPSPHPSPPHPSPPHPSPPHHSPPHSDDEEEGSEILCTFSTTHRPITVVVRRSSSSCSSSSNHTHSLLSPSDKIGTSHAHQHLESDQLMSPTLSQLSG